MGLRQGFCFSESRVVLFLRVQLRTQKKEERRARGLFGYMTNSYLRKKLNDMFIDFS